MPVIELGIARIQKNADVVTRFPADANQWWGAGWWPVVREMASGFWQRSIRPTVDDVLSHATAWACITLIANDIAKMGIDLIAEDTNGICTPIQNPAYSPVLRRPNHYQNRIQFIKYWVISKLTHGNTYVLKERDNRGGPNRGVVTALYILDPSRVKVLVGGGEVFYELQPDCLSGLTEAVTVPASEIIHDIYVAPYHPLCGVSPIYACGLAAQQGLKILQNATRLFENGSQPGGVITAPAAISEVTAKRIQEHWDANFSGESNVGKVAVLGDGLKFERMAMTAVDAQLIDQLKWGDEKICSVFHMPKYKVGVGPDPTYNNIEALSQEYYSECLQILVEEIELCLEEGLKTDPYEIEFDTDDLLRMDAATQMKFITDGVRGGVFTPNEGRRPFNKKPIKGGDTVYLQEQDHSLQWLSERDSAPPPVPQPPASTPPQAVADPPPPDQSRAVDIESAAGPLLTKQFEELEAVA